MLRVVAAKVDFAHLEASRLIKNEQARRSMASQSSEALRTGPVLDNQTLLIAGFSHEAASIDRPIVFDGHSVIDGRDGLIEIPIEVFAALGLDAICFLQAEPSKIFAQRHADVGRTRPARTIAALEEHQARAIAVARAIADALECPLVLITSHDHSTLATIIAGLPNSP